MLRVLTGSKPAAHLCFGTISNRDLSPKEDTFAEWVRLILSKNKAPKDIVVDCNAGDEEAFLLRR